MKSSCLAVLRKEAEQLRCWLIENDLLRTNLIIQRDNQFVYFPVNEEVNIDNAPLMEKEFKLKKKQLKWQEVLDDILPSNTSLSSFDIIGDIAIIRVPPKLIEYQQHIAEAILVTHHNINVVCNDFGITDDYRIRQLKIIGGECRTETVHIEHGVSIELDIAQVYFSPRLAAERKRIADQLLPGETAIDMFAGVAPFSLVISALARPLHITAIELNPVAARYARRNAQRNGFYECINIIEGDAGRVVPKLEPVDHVIMNLPHSADKYFVQAIRQGRIIHYYDILPETKVADRLDWLCRQATLIGKQAVIRGWRTIGTYSPSKIKLAVDISIQ